MPLNLPRIAAALNAYPWMPGRLTRSGRTAPTYCAIGALLRYAGVAQDHIACAEGPSGVHLWAVYGQLLESEYGIPDMKTAKRVMAANDSASSQAEAIERVLGALTGAFDPYALRHATPDTASAPKPGTVPAWESGPDDGAGSLALSP
ncbi:MAG: hypothetical protein ABR499_19060 [Gemmatimonadaceae bacterium]